MLVYQRVPILIPSLCRREGCSLVTLPECFSFIGAQKGEAQKAAESLEGPTMASASDFGASFLQRELGDSNRIFPGRQDKIRI